MTLTSAQLCSTSSRPHRAREAHTPVRGFCTCPNRRARCVLHGRDLAAVCWLSGDPRPAESAWRAICAVDGRRDDGSRSVSGMRVTRPADVSATAAPCQPSPQPGHPRARRPKFARTQWGVADPRPAARVVLKRTYPTMLNLNASRVPGAPTQAVRGLVVLVQVMATRWFRRCRRASASSHPGAGARARPGRGA